MKNSKEATLVLLLFGFAPLLVCCNVYTHNKSKQFASELGFVKPIGRRFLLL
jgi:hypothetical protein